MYSLLMKMCLFLPALCVLGLKMANSDRLSHRMFGTNVRKVLSAEELAMKVLILVVLALIFPNRGMLVLRLLSLRMESLKMESWKTRIWEMGSLNVKI